MSTEITFYQITKSEQKLAALSNLIKSYFESLRPLLIRAPDLKAAQFISQFLWSIPNTFYPHKILDAPSKGLLAISLSEENFIQAGSIFNLSSDVIINLKHYKKIYEFDDLTSETKTHISKAHYQAYEKEGLSICSL